MWIFFCSATAEQFLTEASVSMPSVQYSFKLRCFKIYLNDVRKNSLSSIYFFPLKCNLTVCQAHSVPSAHHVVGKDGQQEFQFIRVDVDVGLDCVP